MKWQALALIAHRDIHGQFFRKLYSFVFPHSSFEQSGCGHFILNEVAKVRIFVNAIGGYHCEE